MTTKISSYVLTMNSAKYLSRILDQLSRISDEIIVLDSGSSDETETIAKQYEQVRFHVNPLKDFKTQRILAEQLCSYDMVLFVDSDEIPDAAFIDFIAEGKQQGFDCDAYNVARIWHVFGKPIHALYPVTSPDHPIRLYNKQTTSFVGSQLVHEAPTGYQTLGTINGALVHLTFENKAELDKKLALYTDIAAQDLIDKQKPVNVIKVIFNPIGAFIKWFFLKQGYKDGLTGLVLGQYAYQYTRLKYQKARKILANQFHNV